jgi:hypothetical protein
MKDGLCNIGNSWVIVHKKKCYGHNVYEKIEDFFHKFGTCYTFKSYTLEIKVFRKIEIYDGFYNCLLCVVIV